jgi:hypothetical protein
MLRRRSLSLKKGKAPIVELSPAEIHKEQDKALEKELIVELHIDPHKEQEVADQVSDSSQGSFVDATQYREDIQSNDEDAGGDTSTPVRVQKDKAFLSASWANMAENEEEARLYENIEQDPPLVIQEQVALQEKH